MESAATPTVRLAEDASEIGAARPSRVSSDCECHQLPNNHGEHDWENGSELC